MFIVSLYTKTDKAKLPSLRLFQWWLVEPIGHLQAVRPPHFFFVTSSIRLTYSLLMRGKAKLPSLRLFQWLLFCRTQNKTATSCGNSCASTSCEHLYVSPSYLLCM